MIHYNSFISKFSFQQTDFLIRYCFEIFRIVKGFYFLIDFNYIKS